ncbi:right-handed parallel beta-helix repeat-containing protein [Martelella alba]|uniref:Right-handed parallel beta-helix repeat-containing protein n=1 Tax=Martelella alba TaxID=2590451 RepID=A0A506U1N0_9HYPH|nr:right-handed parallel beta-helix repeat-containing protein [Martelella alba]TPW27670.1 right-handed parallel beta-helix repeat-containing protein [Martelella alba]
MSRVRSGWMIVAVLLCQAVAVRHVLAFDMETGETLQAKASEIARYLDLGSPGGAEGAIALAAGLLPESAAVPAVITAKAEERKPQPAGAPAATVGPLAPILSDIALQTGYDEKDALVAVTAESGGMAIMLKSGAFSLPTLAEQLASAGYTGLFEQPAGHFHAMMPIVITADAALAIAPGETLEMSTKNGVFLVNTGTLTVHQAVISVSDDHNAEAEFHPFILTVKGGRTFATGTRFSGLGFGERPSLRGVSFVSNRFYPVRSEAYLRDNRFDGLISLELRGLSRFDISGNVIENARGTGLFAIGLSSGVISGNVIDRSTSHGLRLIEAANIRLSGNLIARNGRSGLVAGDDFMLSALENNVFLSNGSDGLVVEGAACVDIKGNASIANRDGGAQVSKSLDVAITGNLLAGNGGDGLAISAALPSQQPTRIAANRIFANASGIRADRFGTLQLTGNDFTHQSPILFSGALSAELPRFLAGRKSGGPFTVSALDEGSISAANSPQLDGFSLVNLSHCRQQGDGL